MEEQLSGADGEILARVSAQVAQVTLNRPDALNALSLGMIEALAGWLDRWEHDEAVEKVVLSGAGKAFCAGGDVRALYNSFKAGSGLHREFFEIEYALDYRIHTYPKPIVADMHGIVMGGGMGLAQGARVRIVRPLTRMAMPETAIGLFPDVGGSYFLSRLPAHAGIYLGLVGERVLPAEAVYVGLADQQVHGDDKENCPALWTLREPIERHFSRASVAEIVSSLESESHPHFRRWADETLAKLRKHSPLMLCVTLEQLRRGATMGLADCFRMELGLMRACFEQGDLMEGIRSVIIDKDNKPRWKHAGIDAVREDEVMEFFAPRWESSKHPLASLQ
ncbi:MAG TPA: enoyl-CoA hydratase/isomerase family protein [Usitatibacter sp.]|jgi:enoyl-CoA hydratase/carnithine racemase|nr:enoyl-CoA hydratase/isomerase family protein [Usitatibacter sp.]